MNAAFDEVIGRLPGIAPGRETQSENPLTRAESVPVVRPEKSDFELALEAALYSKRLNDSAFGSRRDTTVKRAMIAGASALEVYSRLCWRAWRLSLEPVAYVGGVA